MIFGSVCSGIEAASVAWHPLGWTAAWYSEIEKFPSDLLAYHYPWTSNLGDMTKIYENEEFKSHIDVLVGGTPCQSFSVAGLRKGLSDPRGNLALEYVRILDAKRPRWFVWENVPGVLTSSGGRDFGSFIGAISKIGYSFAWRILDAQYFGVPQRRRRVFLVGHISDWRYSAAVLVERESMLRDTPSRRKKRQNIAPTIRARTKGGGRAKRIGTDFDLDGGLIQTTGTLNANGKAAGSATQQDAETGMLVAYGGNNTKGPINKSTAINAKGGSGRMDFESETLIAFSTKDYDADASSVAPTLRAGGHTTSHANAGVMPAICMIEQNTQCSTPPLPSLRGAETPNYADLVKSCVRRLTPKECERLQGFPDDYTLIPGRQADGPRYKALGNSMAIPCMRWIGERIQTVENIILGK